MKFKFILLSSVWLSIACAQVPEGYYDDAQGLQGYELKTALKNIINNQTVLSYGSLDNYYSQTDKDLYFENDQSLLDIYSENPNGTDPYQYGFGEGDQCGNYNSESDCWNKEHVFPQGFFNEQLPMRTDLHQVLPTDGYVNGRRSNYPFGNVQNAGWTSDNGSKLGNCVANGHTGTCFEPIDEFKGDIARIFLYFATRYEDQVTSSSWDNPDADNNNPLNGTKNQVYEDWYINQLLQWHDLDPVSQKEIDRNNKVYQIQHNRNPFVDHPEYVHIIWGPGLATTDVEVENGLTIYPNPVKDRLQIKSDESIENVELFSVEGKKLNSYKIQKGETTISVKSLPKGIYLLKSTIKGKIQTQKFIKE